MAKSITYNIFSCLQYIFLGGFLANTKQFWRRLCGPLLVLVCIFELSQGHNDCGLICHEVRMFGTDPTITGSALAK